MAIQPEFWEFGHESLRKTEAGNTLRFVAPSESKKRTPCCSRDRHGCVTNGNCRVSLFHIEKIYFYFVNISVAHSVVDCKQHSNRKPNSKRQTKQNVGTCKDWYKCAKTIFLFAITLLQRCWAWAVSSFWLWLQKSPWIHPFSMGLLLLLAFSLDLLRG